MRTYICAWIPGGTCFFTVNLAQRRDNTLLVDRVHLLRRAFRSGITSHPFVIDAMVVVPEHLYCIRRLLDGDDRFDICWRLIKTAFSTRKAHTRVRRLFRFFSLPIPQAKFFASWYSIPLS